MFYRCYYSGIDFFLFLGIDRVRFSLTEMKLRLNTYYPCSSANLNLSLIIKPDNLMNCKQYKSVPIGRIVVDDEADGSDYVHEATEGQ